MCASNRLYFVLDRNLPFSTVPQLSCQFPDPSEQDVQIISTCLPTRTTLDAMITEPMDPVTILATQLLQEDPSVIPLQQNNHNVLNVQQTNSLGQLLPRLRKLAVLTGMYFSREQMTFPGRTVDASRWENVHNSDVFHFYSDVNGHSFYCIYSGFVLRKTGVFVKLYCCLLSCSNEWMEVTLCVNFEQLKRASDSKMCIVQDRVWLVFCST